MNSNNKYLDIIMKKYPQLIIEKCNFNKEGQNNDILIINDDLVFRFPKHIEGIEKLKRENRILLR